VIEGAPLFHDYASEVTLATLEQQLAYLTGRVGPLGAVFVDHIGLMKATQKYERRQLELGDLSWGLKRLAKDYDTHVFMASQLNRGSLHRADPEPDLGDLRESGNLEQDCSNVILLNKPKQQEREGELDLVIGKNRDGEKDITVTVVLQGQFQRVTDLSRFAA
jgi:replicative DNA helicase